MDCWLCYKIRLKLMVALNKSLCQILKYYQSIKTKYKKYSATNTYLNFVIKFTFVS